MCYIGEYLTCTHLLCTAAYCPVRRDLHDENILVTLREYPNDPHQFEYKVMLSDVGEGKMLFPSAADPDLPEGYYASYGNPEYRAPEVQGPSGWTEAADVWSFGVIAVKLLEMRRSICDGSCAIPPWVLEEVQEEYPDKDFSHTSRDMGFIVPLSLKRVLEPCLRHNPNERPAAHAAAMSLDEVSMEFFNDDEEEKEKNRDVKWTYWDWRTTKAAGRTGKGLVLGKVKESLGSPLDAIEELSLGKELDLD